MKTITTKQPDTYPVGHLGSRASYCRPNPYRCASLTRSLLFLVVLLGLTLPTRAYNFSSTCPSGQVLYYTIIDSTHHTVSVNGLHQPLLSGALIIPESVTYHSTTYSVTQIEHKAFSGCRYLTSVTIPNSVTFIAASAFSGCSGLTSMTIPNSVTSIGDRAFSGCRGITSMTIPNSVTYIGEEAFQNCSSLTSVTIRNYAITPIGKRAFYNCTNLTSLTIGNSVSTIGEGAFYQCYGLTSVNIPNSVTSIGKEAFYYCNSLTSVTIPNSVTSIGKEAFAYCYKLTNFTIPDSVTTIGENAFKYVKNIIYHGTATGSPWGALTLNGYIDGIFIYADSTKTTLTGCIDTAMAVTIPNTVTSIGDYAFSDCSSITYVTIGNAVTSIGENSFALCSSLTSVTIPNSVTSIDEYAFWACTSLTSVTIGNAVTSIGEGAFLTYSGLISVTSNAVVAPTLGNNAFYISKTTPLFIPRGSRDSYIAQGWDNYFDIREQSSIARTNANTYTIGTDNMRIVVRGAEGQRIRIYNNIGRMLNDTQSAQDVCVCVMPTTGVYMVQVGNDAARKVVLVR